MLHTQAPTKTPAWKVVKLFDLCAMYVTYGRTDTTNKYGWFVLGRGSKRMLPKCVVVRRTLKTLPKFKMRKKERGEGGRVWQEKGILQAAFAAYFSTILFSCPKATRNCLGCTITFTNRNFKKSKVVCYQLVAFSKLIIFAVVLCLFNSTTELTKLFHKSTRRDSILIKAAKKSSIFWVIHVIIAVCPSVWWYLW